MYWDNVRQARERLNGSLVCYNGEPVYIRTVEEGNAYIERNGQRATIRLDDEGWNNYRDIPSLGFINTPEGLFYVHRTPRPTMRHGLTSENTTTKMFSKGQFRVSRNHNVITLYQRNHEAFLIRQRNDFPSFEEALAHVVETETPVAISPIHAVVPSQDGIQKLIRYTDTCIAVIVDSEVMLRKKYNYCREELEATCRITNVREV